MDSERADITTDLTVIKNIRHIYELFYANKLKNLGKIQKSPGHNVLQVNQEDILKLVCKCYENESVSHRLIGSICKTHAL